MLRSELAVSVTGGSGRAGPALDERQRLVVAQTAGSQLVIGAPGSGKSVLLRECLAVRLEDGWSRTEMLGLTLGAASARRWRSDLVARTGTESPAITTLHSLALKLVEQDAAERGTQTPRLLSNGDQLDLVRSVLAQSDPAKWPALFHQALPTTAFAERVRDFIIRAALAGLDPQTLPGAPRALEVWRPLAAVWRSYLRVRSLAGAMDYADLLDRAAELAVRGRAPAYRIVCVDDFAEHDPRQVRLLRALIRPGTRLVAASDPDSVVDRFRGAAVEAVARFSELFPDPRPTVVLTGRYRFGPAVEGARVALVRSLPMQGLPGAVVREHRTGGRPAGDTSVDVITYPDELAQAAAIADMLRRFALAGLAEGQQPRWREAVVLARSSGQLVTLEQALLTAGVPVHGGESGRPLAAEPVVALLSTGLRLAARLAGFAVDEPPAQRIAQLLTSPMGGLDPVALRRLMIELRRADLKQASHAGRPAATMYRLLAAALSDPAPLLAIDPRRHPAVEQVLAIQRRIAAAAAQIAAGDDAEGPLWTLWSDSPRGPGAWARRLRAAALAGGPAAAAAHRDLDAAMAVFAHVRRSQARGGSQGVLDLLADLTALRWPGDRLASETLDRNAVTLMTVHRARGRQWPLVVVAGVQEGSWPGPSGGIGLLGEELAADPGATAVGERAAAVADERRAFHVALTRASQHLVVTAVAAADSDAAGARPSRFLSELGLAIRQVDSVPRRQLSATGLVAALRREAFAAGPRASQASRLLAQLVDDPDIPGADPAAWWGISEPTCAPNPLVAPQQPITLTVTGLTELAACPRRWFLVRTLHARPPTDSAAGIGQLVHRVHQAWANGELARDLDSADELVQRVWPALSFEAPWHADRRRTDVSHALNRLLVWLTDNAERIEFAEQSFTVDLSCADGQVVTLTGKADIGLRSGEHGLAILDIKTAKATPPTAEVQRHVQLAGYQMAVLGGALGADAPGGSAGAGLLMASVSGGAATTGPKVLWQQPLDSQEGAADWFAQIVSDAVLALRAERFPAITSVACRTCPVRALCPAKSPHQEVGPQ